jgi:transcriptional regulator with XRE-family HTH domain
MLRRIGKGMEMAKGVDEEESAEVQALYVYVGDRVRSLRELAKLSQKDLADLTEMRQPYVFEIEKLGVNLSLRSLFRIATALGVTPRDLLPPARGQADLETGYRDMRERVIEALGILSDLDTTRAKLADLVEPDRTKDESG